MTRAADPNCRTGQRPPDNHLPTGVCRNVMVGNQAVFMKPLRFRDDGLRAAFGPVPRLHTPANGIVPEVSRDDAAITFSIAICRGRSRRSGHVIRRRRVQNTTFSIAATPA